MRVDAGTYIGDGVAGGKVITLTNCVGDCRLTDTFILVAAEPYQDAYWTSDKFAANYAVGVSSSGNQQTGYIEGLGVATFTAKGGLNTAGQTYGYLVCQHDGAVRDIATGSYWGNGQTGQTGLALTPGMTAKAAIIAAVTGSRGCHGAVNAGGAATCSLTNTASITGAVTGFAADRLTIGSESNVNYSNSLHQYVCFAETAGVSGFVDYIGNATDNRTIAVPGNFQPDAAFITHAAAYSVQFRSVGLAADRSITMNRDTGLKTNCLQNFVATGIEVGTDSSVNAASQSYYAWAFKQSAGEPQPADSAAWLAGGWSKRKKILFGAVSASLVNFPVAVVLNAGNAGTLFADLGANFLKLAVADQNGAACQAEVAYWDAANQKALLYVKIPSLPTSGGYCHLYWDAAHADNSSYVGAIGSVAGKSVWDSDYDAVWHLCQDPTGGAGCIKDSTSNARHGTPMGTWTGGSIVDSGPLGRTLTFNGTNAYLDFGQILNYTANDLTHEMGLSVASLPAGQYPLLGWKGVYGQAGHYLNFSDTGTVALTCNTPAAVTAASAPGGTVAVGGGYALAAVADLGTTAHKIYRDGIAVQNGFNQVNSIASSAKPFLLGAYDSASYFFGGAIAEYRVSKIARSAAWEEATGRALRNMLAVTMGQQPGGAGGVITVNLNPEARAKFVRWSIDGGAAKYYSGQSVAAAQGVKTLTFHEPVAVKDVFDCASAQQQVTISATPLVVDKQLTRKALVTTQVIAAGLSQRAIPLAPQRVMSYVADYLSWCYTTGPSATVAAAVTPVTDGWNSLLPTTTADALGDGTVCLSIDDLAVSFGGNAFQYGALTCRANASQTMFNYIRKSDLDLALSGQNATQSTTMARSGGVAATLVSMGDFGYVSGVTANNDWRILKMGAYNDIPSQSLHTKVFSGSSEVGDNVAANRTALADIGYGCAAATSLHWPGDPADKWYLRYTRHSAGANGADGWEQLYWAASTGDELHKAHNYAFAAHGGTYEDSCFLFAWRDYAAPNTLKCKIATMADAGGVLPATVITTALPSETAGSGFTCTAVLATGPDLLTFKVLYLTSPGLALVERTITKNRQTNEITIGNEVTLATGLSLMHNYITMPDKTFEFTFCGWQAANGDLVLYRKPERLAHTPKLAGDGLDFLGYYSFMSPAMTMGDKTLVSGMRAGVILANVYQEDGGGWLYTYDDGAPHHIKMGQTWDIHANILFEMNSSGSVWFVSGGRTGTDYIRVFESPESFLASGFHLEKAAWLDRSPTPAADTIGRGYKKLLLGKDNRLFLFFVESTPAAIRVREYDPATGWKAWVNLTYGDSGGSEPVTTYPKWGQSLPVKHVAQDGEVSFHMFWAPRTVTTDFAGQETYGYNLCYMKIVPQGAAGSNTYKTYGADGVEISLPHSHLGDNQDCVWRQATIRYNYPQRANSTAYAVGDHIWQPESQGQTYGHWYVCTQAGTTAATVPASYADPAHHELINDGAAVFKEGGWYGPDVPAAYFPVFELVDADTPLCSDQFYPHTGSWPGDAGHPGKYYQITVWESGRWRIKASEKTLAFVPGYGGEFYNIEAKSDPVHAQDWVMATSYTKDKATTWSAESFPIKAFFAGVPTTISGDYVWASKNSVARQNIVFTRHESGGVGGGSIFEGYRVFTRLNARVGRLVFAGNFSGYFMGGW